LLARPADLLAGDEGRLFVRALGRRVERALAMVAAACGCAVDEVEFVQAGWQADPEAGPDAVVGGYAAWGRDPLPVAADDDARERAWGRTTARDIDGETQIDPRRIAMIGLSYGGYYSLYTAALEPRIKVAVASCSFSDMHAITDGKTEGRLFDLTPSDVASLIAPRPLQIQGGTNDKGLPIDRSRAAAKRTALVYEKLGAKDKFTFEEFDGGHEFRGSLVWPFLKKWL
jgi:fermentation-respiration switch protein FrsA (DUF1100 family)